MKESNLCNFDYVNCQVPELCFDTYIPFMIDLSGNKFKENKEGETKMRLSTGGSEEEDRQRERKKDKHKDKYRDRKKDKYKDREYDEREKDRHKHKKNKHVSCTLTPAHTHTHTHVHTSLIENESITSEDT